MGCEHAPHSPEGDEVGIDQGRTEEGAQQAQDGGARGHVSPPDPGQEGLEGGRVRLLDTRGF